MKTKFLFIILLIAISACGQTNGRRAEDLSPNINENEEVKVINQSFFDILKKQGSNNAVDFLFKKSTVLNSSIIKAKLDTVGLVFGAYTGVEKITEKGISNALILTSFLVKYEKQPVRFTIVYYKPQQEWKLYKFQIDEGALEELEDSAKLFIFK